MTPESPRALTILTFEEYRCLVTAVTAEDPAIGVYTALLGETGLRKSEGLKLKWQDIDLNTGRVTVVRSKSGLPRYVPLTQFAQQSLGTLVRVFNCPYVFVRLDTGKPWKDPCGPFKRGCESTGLKWVRGFHDLRHFRATQWLRHGVDVRTVQELLGHSEITTTMRYVHYLQKQAFESVRAAEALEISGGRKLDGGPLRQTQRLFVENAKPLKTNGAKGGTRTPTPLRAPEPKSGASANSATFAPGRISIVECFYGRSGG